MAPKAPPVDGSAWISPEPGLPVIDPIPLTSLSDGVVIVVFWSAGCEASLHRLRQLEDLLPAGRLFEPDREVWRKQTAGQRIDVIAVHTPRYPHDEDLDVVRSAMDRYRLPFTVVHDPEYLTWNRYNPKGWPSTAVIDVGGRLTGIQTGTGDVAVVADAVLLALAAGDRPGRRGRRRSARRRHDDSQPAAVPVFDRRQRDYDQNPDRDLVEQRLRLHHPEGVAVLPDNRVVISDTGNDRLLVAGPTSDPSRYHLEYPIELFDEPTGLVHAGDERVVVIERGWNRLWLLDLSTGGRDLITDSLDRPSGCSLDGDGSLVVADSVANRLYRISRDFTVGAIAGSGACGTESGRSDEAELAQPVAVGRGSTGLIFLDAASSNVRLLTDDGTVVDITDNDFYEWGLIDGAAHRARLQRPTDLCLFDDDSVLISDTGNNRLRLLHQRRIHTIGLRGLNRPTAVTRAGRNHALVADTGNHGIVLVDLDRRRARNVLFDGFDEMLTRNQRQVLSRPDRSGSTPDPVPVSS